MRHGYIYIMANHKNGTLYIGSTAGIQSCVMEHKTKANPKSFTAQYGCNRLVYFEYFENIAEATNRERAMKRYKRQWKVDLIEKDNPDWFDLRLDWDD